MKDWFYFKKFQAWWMADDRKPKGKVKRSLKRGAKNQFRKAINKEVNNDSDE